MHRDVMDGEDVMKVGSFIHPFGLFRIRLFAAAAAAVAVIIATARIRLANMNLNQAGSDRPDCTSVPTTGSGWWSRGFKLL